MAIAETEQRQIPVWNNTLNMNVHVRGSGPALVYFHPAPGFVWDPFLEQLSQHYTIYAPEFPGTTPGDPHAIHKVDALTDAVLMYEEALRTLGIEGAVGMGQSFGGMIALELASTFPSLFSQVMVMAPIGLWKDAAPVTNWIAAGPEELPGILFHDPEGPVAQAVLGMPEDPELAVKITAQLIWNNGCTGKFVWPIPDRGLSKRLHRIQVPTLVIWGENDALISSVYAADFGAAIANCQVEIIPECGHIPQAEQMDKTYALVADFLQLKAAVA